MNLGYQENLQICSAVNGSEEIIQSLLKRILPDLAEKFLIAMMIAIEFMIRINQTLLKIFQADFDEKFLSRLCS